ncbi:MAG: glycosyltransferase family 4 protein [Chloroflexota bacterium]|nr:glycosyltransferase family 4 protein [Chloroflexota bacterium]
MGSDVRLASVAMDKNKYVRLKTKDENQVRSAISSISKYIDVAIVGDYELYEYVCDSFKKVVIIRQAVDLQQYTPFIPSRSNKKPVIVHAPSDKNIKGTEYVVEAVASLEKDYDLEFIMVHGVPHHQAKEIYQGSDIIVDQLLCGTHGVFAVESMAMGKPVICYIRDDLRDTYPQGLPVVSANPENIYEQLKCLVENPDLRSELGQRGREYAEKHHDSLKIAKQLMDLYESL